MSKIDWDKVSDNPRVISMIKQIRELEITVREIDPDAMIEYGLQAISINDKTQHCRSESGGDKINNMKGQYVIIDLRNMDFMKNEKGEINYYDTEEEAGTVCGMYEFENAWVLKLIYNHIEQNDSNR